MLARRFSIVCLLVAIFGMGLATLVAETSRVAPIHATQSLFSMCDSGGVSACR
ncbi:hypothetical protein [Mesorhizobium sp. CAU 1741]|uniref:hypothetical protein n=1 Tax=Mesorhizobium sp. CAU 1741 TaxID=3140366 RepID=UPI00325B98AD